VDLAKQLGLDPVRDEAALRQILQRANIPAQEQANITLPKALDQIKLWKDSGDKATRRMAYQTEDSMEQAIREAGRDDLANLYRDAVKNYRQGQSGPDVLDNSGAFKPGSTTGPITDQAAASKYLWDNLRDMVDRKGDLILPNFTREVSGGAGPGATTQISDPLRGHLRAHVPGTPLSLPLGVRFPAQVQGFAGNQPSPREIPAATAAMLNDPR